MNTYAVYDDSGFIKQLISTLNHYVEVGDEVSDDTHYVDITTHAVEAKQLLNPETTVDGLVATLTGLPKGLNVETNNLGTVTDDSPLVIEYDVPGTFVISLSGRVDYLSCELEVTVGDA